MKKSDAFSGFHPLVNMLYFVLAIGCSFAFLHPVCLGISLACALAYMLLQEGVRALRFVLTFLLPMLLLTAAINPLFSHEGVTTLFYLPGGNPITLESIFFGNAAACRLAAVVVWFRCYTAVMTSDKFVHLFGRVIPALSLVISMALRFVPRFTAQMKSAAQAQRGIGRDISQGSLLQRARHGVRILSITVTWALENAVETADSMKSRGYGLPGRSAFSIFKFDKRDRFALLYILLCGGYVITGAALGGLRWLYYPQTGGAWTGGSFSVFAVYLAFLALPLILNRKEAAQWKS